MYFFIVLVIIICYLVLDLGLYTAILVAFITISSFSLYLLVFSLIDNNILNF